MITRRLARPLNALPSTWTCPTCVRSAVALHHRPTTSSSTNPVRSRTPLLRRHLATPSYRQSSESRKSGHAVPELAPYDESFRDEGVPGLFTPLGFQLGWTSYQAMIVQKLNELTAGETYQGEEVKNLAIKFARDPMNASLFNHASMAHNNHFFYQSFSNKPTPLISEQPGQDSMADLRQSLENTFGSIDTLRTTMLDTASAMFGPGFVWLVWARNVGGGTRAGAWRIVTTYSAGTPYPEAGFRQQGIDTNTENRETYEGYGRSVPAVGAFGRHSAVGKEAARFPPGGTSVMPVLCVNTWEHVYIYDYGLPGKRKYLSEWWEAINWPTVKARTPEEAFERFQAARHF